MKIAKIILLFLFLKLIPLSGSEVNPRCIFFGYINGYDSTRCGCCGGYII
jgi:hypothetical protein